MMTSALLCASASSCSPFSAAASPWAILRARSSMATISFGQPYFMTRKTSVANTIICTMSVRLMFTVLSPARAARAGLVRGLQCAHERVGEREEQREADTDHGHGVEQTRHQEHLH